MINFFEIRKVDISSGGRYSFPIYCYCKNDDTRQVYFYANEEIAIEDFDLFQYEKRMKEFQIYFKDIKSYLLESKTDYKEFRELNKHRFDYVLLCEKRKKNNASKALLDMLMNSVDTQEKNNLFFKRMRLRVVESVASFDVSEAEFINTVICLVEKVFTRDYKSVKIAAVSFSLAQKVGVVEKQQLSNMLLIALYKNMGKVATPELKVYNDYSDILKNESSILSKSIYLFQKFDDPIFIHLVKEFEKLKANEEVVYKKIHEIILLAELLCFSLDCEKDSASNHGELLKSVISEFEFVDELARALETLWQ